MPHSHHSPLREGLCRAARRLQQSCPGVSLALETTPPWTAAPLLSAFGQRQPCFPAFAGFCYFNIPLANVLLSFLSLSLLGDQTPLFALRLLDTERVSSFILGLTLDVSIVFFLSQLTSLQEASARLAMGKNPSGARDRNRASVFGPAWPRWVRSHYLSCLHACHHSCPSLLPSSFSDPVTINIKSASCLCPSAISTQRCSQPHVSPQI